MLIDANRKRRLVICSLILSAIFLPTGLFAQTGTLFVEGDNVGIGTGTPATQLHLRDSPDTSVLRLERSGPARIEFRDTVGGVSWDFRTTSGNTFVLTRSDTLVNEMLVNSLGDLIITGSLKARGGDGTIDPGDTFPDYVFAPDYELMPLSDLEAFVGENRHLPGVMSSEDVRQEGVINMTALQLQLLEKVEELTLYVIEQQREIEELRAQLATRDDG